MAESARPATATCEPIIEVLGIRNTQPKTMNGSLLPSISRRQEFDIADDTQALGTSVSTMVTLPSSSSRQGVHAASFLGSEQQGRWGP